MNSVADGQALAARLRDEGRAHDAETVAWLCARVGSLEAQLAAKMGTVEGVCSICGAKGWYVDREKTDPAPSKESVVGLIGSGVARLLGARRRCTSGTAC